MHFNPFAALGPQGNANGWVVHIDGLWVGPVASMLYRDYSREWIPNVYGARENPEAMISFLHFGPYPYFVAPRFVLIVEANSCITRDRPRNFMMPINVSAQTSA